MKTYQCINQSFDKTKPTSCDLYKGCKSPFMLLDGDITSEILIIGEAPGEQEDSTGKPFVGDSGKLLRHSLKLTNVTSFAMTNAIRCRPPGNRDPKTTELKSCRSFIDDDIEKMPNLKLLVLVGNYAMQTILGHKGVLEHSGTYTSITIDNRKFGVLCLMHPSYVLQNQTELNKFINHTGRIRNALTGDIVDPSDEGTYTIIDTPLGWFNFLDKVKQQPLFSYDLETNALDPYRDDSEITCISFSTYPREACAIVPNEWMMNSFKLLMEDPKYRKIGHNTKFDSLWLRVKYDITVQGIEWDTEIGQYLLDENESHGLKSLAWKHTKLGGYEDHYVQGQPHMHAGSTNLLRYSCIDSDITRRLYDIQKPEIEKDAGLIKTMKTLLLPVSDVILEMERRGIRIDPIKLMDCEKKVDAYLNKVDLDITAERSVKRFLKNEGVQFNPRSAPQLRKLLFDAEYEDLSPISKTKKTRVPSTERAVLEFYADSNNFCRLLGDRSLYGSMKSKMIKELNEYNIGGRIHTHYWLFQTSTGRSTSDDPNLQNVTKGKKDVVGIRDVFIADDGFDLLECDYNQHELRCMAELAEDDALYKACQTGDVHAATAKTLLNKSTISEDERRDVGKCFNFGLIYGLTIYGIMKRLKCTESVAKSYLDRFFGEYFKTKLYMDATTWFVKNNGYVKSRLGRYRRFPIYDELDDKCVREGINMPVQSLAGDILLFALIGISEMLKREKAKSFLCLEIHDSVLLNLHKDEHYLIPLIKEIMLNYFRKYIPFKYELAVDMKLGPTWGSMRDI